MQLHQILLRNKGFVSAVLMPVILRSDSSVLAGAVAAAAFSSSSSLLTTTKSGVTRATHSTSAGIVDPQHSSCAAQRTTPSCGSSLMTSHRGDRTACQASTAQYHDGKITVTRQSRPRSTFSSTVSSLFGSTNSGSRKKKKKKKRRTNGTNSNDTELVELDVYYRIYNPDSLQSGEIPLLVVHGGP